MVREMDCILLRGWINRRITESQSRNINWFGMYAVNNNNIGTCTSYLSLSQRLGFTLFMTQFGRLLIVGFSFFAHSFSPLRNWTFGAGYNHPAVVRQPFFFLTWTTSPCYSYFNLFNVSLVVTDNKGQLKAVVRSQNIKINIGCSKQG